MLDSPLLWIGTKTYTDVQSCIINPVNILHPQFTDALIPSPNIKLVEFQLRDKDYAKWLRWVKYPPPPTEDEGGLGGGTGSGGTGSGGTYTEQLLETNVSYLSLNFLFSCRGSFYES